MTQDDKRVESLVRSVLVQVDGLTLVDLARVLHAVARAAGGLRVLEALECITYGENCENCRTVVSIAKAHVIDVEADDAKPKTSSRAVN